MPPQYHPQHGHFPQIRHQTPTASPPIPNGAAPYPGHHGHHGHHLPPRGHSPQPPMGRPDSRNDGRRMGSGMVPPPPPGAHPGITYMPAPPIYNGPPVSQPMMHPHGAQYYPAQPQPQQAQPYGEERRPPQPHPQQPPTGYPAQPPAQSMPMPPPPDAHQAQTSSHTSVSIPAHTPLPDRRPMDPQPPPSRETAPEVDPRQPPMLNTDSAIKKLPQRRSHSIFTPVEENRSILGQHSKLFNTEESTIKEEPASRSQSVDGGGSSRTSPPVPRSHSSMDKSRNVSLPEVAFGPPSRTNSLTGGPLSSRPRGPKLTVQIPDGGSEQGGSAVTGGSSSPRNPADTPTHSQRRHGSVVLPPPSPSASALLSAGATGPPNPFAKPPPQQSINTGNANNNETPVSALPSRFLTGEFLPSPSSFYPEWNYKASDSNTLPSPLNFATPVVGTGPSFLREDQIQAASSAGTTASSATTATTTTTAGASDSLKSREAVKRKSEGSAPSSASSHGPPTEPKRVKVE